MTPEKEERYRQLEAKFGRTTEALPKDRVPSRDAPAMSTEEKLAAYEKKFGPPPAIKLGKEEPATLVENVRHAAGGLPQAAADVADLPHNVAEGVDAVASWIPPSVRETFREVSPVTAGALDLFQMNAKRQDKPSELPGVKQALEVAAPEYENASPYAEAIRTATEWGAGGIPKLLRGGIKQIPQNTRDADVDLVMGGTAAGGQAAGEYLGGETGGAVGEMIGGVTGLIGALKGGRTGGLDANSEVMLQAIQEQFEDPVQALEDIRRRLEAGEIGTLGDLTRELGIMDIENAVARTPWGRRSQAKQAERRINQIYEDVTKPMRNDADPTQAPRSAEQQIRDEVQATQEAGDRVIQQQAEETAGLKQALAEEQQKATDAARAAEERAGLTAAAADQRLAEADPGLRPDQYSRQADSRISLAEQKYAETVTRPAWKAYDEGPNVDISDLQSELQATLDAMDPAELANIRRKYGSHLDEILKLETTELTPRGLSLIIQRMKDDVSEAYQAGSAKFADREAEKLYKEIENWLSQPVNSPEYAKAVAATKKGYDQFGPGFIGDARRGEPETMLQRFGLEGDQGAATARYLAEMNMPSVNNEVGDYILAQAVRQGDKLGEGFLVRYEAMLDSLPPEVRGKVVELIQARQTAKTAASDAATAAKTAEQTTARTGREAEGLDRALEAEQSKIQSDVQGVEQGLRGDIRGKYAENPNKTIDSLLSDPDGVDDLKQLMDDMEGIQQVDSFKANVRERLERMLFDQGSDSIQARAKAYRDFRDMREKLVDANVLTEADSNRMLEALERTESTRLRQASRAADVTARADEHINLLASGGAAAVLGPMPGAYSLMIGGAIRRSLATLLRGKMTEKRQQILDTYLTDPEKFLKDLDLADVKNQEEAYRKILTAMVGASQAAEIIGAE